MNEIFTHQPDVVTAGTDVVISIMAAVSICMIAGRYGGINIVCKMSMLLFAAIFAAGIAGAALHGIKAVESSFVAEQIIRGVTAACLGGISVPVVYLCMYCVSGEKRAARLGQAALILWIVTVILAAASALRGGKAFGPVYIYASMCIVFAACSGIYCILSGKSKSMIYILICVAGAGIGILFQNLLEADKTIELILEFNRSGIAHLAVIAILPVVYIWCDKIISEYS